MGAENFGDKLVWGSLDENREVTEEKLSLQRSASLKSCDKEDIVEEIVEELKTCLPKWVTQEQVRDMIRGISGNVVEIVDHFYEHETKFYEQVSAFVSLSSRGVSLGNDEVFVSKLEFTDCKSEGNQSSCSSQFQKLRSMSSSQKSRISPVKRITKLKGKQKKKKVKACSKVDSGGPKQATITKFFAKASSHET